MSIDAVVSHNSPFPIQAEKYVKLLFEYITKTTMNIAHKLGFGILGFGILLIFYH